MACPLFVPASPLAPLDEMYGGYCFVQPQTPIPIEMLRVCCNIGYARGVCQHAAHSNVDAFRFIVKAKRDGVITVAWSSERDHHPVAVGTLLLAGNPRTEDPLECQASAYAASWVR
jgi:hypothetical protein